MIDFSMPGRLLGASKSRYRHDNPGHEIVFNANLFTRPAGKIWYGDLNLTLDSEDLQRLATDRNEELFVLREYDGRFNKELAPTWDAAVRRFAPSSAKT